MIKFKDWFAFILHKCSHKKFIFIIYIYKFELPIQKINPRLVCKIDRPRLLDINLPWKQHLSLSLSLRIHSFVCCCCSSLIPLPFPIDRTNYVFHNLSFISPTLAYAYVLREVILSLSLVEMESSPAAMKSDRRWRSKPLQASKPSLLMAFFSCVAWLYVAGRFVPLP